jgi:phosphoribosylaminoimidazole-succinocarboxamide synthase
LNHITPTHFVTANIDEMPEEVQKHKGQLEGRAMLVKKAKVIPLEAIVRGYLTGGQGDMLAHSLSDQLILDRLCLVRIQKERNGPRDRNAF